MAAPPTAIRGVSVNSQNERRRKRYAEDPDYRKAVLESNRAGRAARREEVNARARHAYANDERHRTRKRLANSSYRREGPAKQSERLCKRYAEDPEYRKAVLERNRAFRLAHRDEINAKARAAYARDDGYRRRKRLAGNKWYSPEKRLAQVYGLSVEDYNAMLARQGGACAICKQAPTRRPLFVDHCHTTGKVRGLLCHGCNAALGFMRDDHTRTSAATEYLLKLKRHDETK
jgi:hypothetical protein